MKALRAGRCSLAILAVAFGLAVLACLLPEDPYQRWQLLDGTIHERVRWMYERAHFDPTPVDVVVVGPSRSVEGVDGPLLGESLAARGLPSHVVNFSLNDTGRNMNYAVLRQLFQTRTPRLIVIDVTEIPSHRGHKAFKYVAPAQMLVDPGYIGNLNYLPDLAYLPFRQMRLFIADLWPGPLGLTKRFEPSRYDGSSPDTSGPVEIGGRVVLPDTPASMTRLVKGVRRYDADLRPETLPRWLADVEFGDERHYIRQIVALAQSRNVKVAFLFLPVYAGSSKLLEQAFYERYGPVWNAGFLSGHPEWYRDANHLDRAGATQLTQWLGQRVAATLGGDQRRVAMNRVSPGIRPKRTTSGPIGQKVSSSKPA